MNVIRLPLVIVAALFATPEAERDPEAWVTRFAAHLGLGAVVWLLLVRWVGPWSAATVVSLAYLAWEGLQWRGGWRMMADAALDWVAVAMGVCALTFVWQQDANAALACGVSTVAVAVAGVLRRSRHRV